MMKFQTNQDSVYNLTSVLTTCDAHVALVQSVLSPSQLSSVYSRSIMRYSSSSLQSASVGGQCGVRADPAYALYIVAYT